MPERIREIKPTRQMIQDLQQRYCTAGCHIRLDQLYITHVIMHPASESSTAALLIHDKTVCHVTATRSIRFFRPDKPTFEFTDKQAFEKWRSSLSSRDLPLGQIHFSSLSEPFQMDFMPEHAAFHLSMHCFRKPGFISPADVQRTELQINYDPEFSMTGKYRLQIDESRQAFFSLALHKKEVIVSAMDCGIDQMYLKAHRKTSFFNI